MVKKQPDFFSEPLFYKMLYHSKKLYEVSSKIPLFIILIIVKGKKCLKAKVY
jgi:hypothetical protein